MRFRSMVLLLLSASVPAADPPTFDELVAKLLDARAKKADTEKAAAAAEAELKTRFAALRDQLAKLGIDVGPVPPDPAPPPKPVDPLASALKKAFEVDKGLREDALQLAALYREAAKLARDPKVPSSNELLRRVREASATLVGPDVLQVLRTVVAGELRGVLGVPSDDALGDDRRAAAAAKFLQLATILEGF